MKTVIYHTAPWCAPCKQTKPVAKRLAEKSGATFREINIDVEEAYIKDIRGVPTVVIEESGVIVEILTPTQINPRSLTKAIVGDPQ